MSTSKYIDIICIAAISLTFILLLLFFLFADFNQTTTQDLSYQEKLFDNETVHTIDIRMEDWDSFIASCEDEEYTLCDVVIDGETFSDIAIRAKGNTSLSQVKSMDSERYSFKLEFDQYQDGNSYYGLDKLCLNNLIQDNTMMKDYLVYTMMNDFSVDSPLCSYAYITVNGEDWGLYLAVESIEESFLNRNYNSLNGDLYKPDSMSMGGGRGNGKNFDADEFSADEDNSETQEQKDTTLESDNNSSTENINSQKEQMNEQTPPGNMDNMFQGQAPPGDMPDDITPPDNMGEMPDGMEPPDNKGEMPEGITPSDNTEKNSESSNTAENNNSASKTTPNFSGNGSDDVKLKYIDDNVDSYSNIFDNAKTAVTSGDQNRLIKALKNLSSYSELEETLNTEEVLRYFVVHNFVCNGDSYTGMMIHNYYLYEEDGQLSMIPWDYNLAFGTFQGGSASSSVNADIDNPVSNGTVDDRPMVGWIFSDEKYTNQYHELFEEFIEEWFNSGKLDKLISSTAAMIEPYVEKDPTKFCTTDEFTTAISALSQFNNLRAQAVKLQLQGDNTAVDVGELNLSDLGTMGSNGGGKNNAQPNENNTQAENTADENSTQAQTSTDKSNAQPEKPVAENNNTNPTAENNGDMQAITPSENGNNSQAPTAEGDGNNIQAPSTEENGNTPEKPDNAEQSNNRSDSKEDSKSFDVKEYIYLGICFVVLIFGIIIAIKRKR